MKSPWVNILLLGLLVLQTISGYFGFTNGREPAAWILWLHGIGAYVLLVLFFFKMGIILDAWRRKKHWSGRRFGFAITLGLLILTIISGILWTFNGPIYLGGFSLVSLHIYLAVPLMILMLWHGWHMRFIRRVPGATGRRLFLGGLATVTAGMFLWFTVRRLKALAGLTGARRRFTGSYEVGSYSPDYPIVSWIADRPPVLDHTTWQLRIEGSVATPLVLTLNQLSRYPKIEVAAALDCTGGWFTRQRWSGVAIGELLKAAGISPSARSATVESVTGYKRRFSLEEIGGGMLALGTFRGEIGEDFLPLDSGHGAPARLLLPERRGMEWVKWVEVIRVNDTVAELQSPLPLQ